MTYVVDSSVAVRWYLSEETHPAADAVLNQMIETPELFAVPELFFFEVFTVLARVHPAFPRVYSEAFLPAGESGILRYPMTPGLAEGAAPFVALGLTGYDAVYAALARELGATWLTFDTRAHALISTEGVSADINNGLPGSFGS